MSQLKAKMAQKHGGDSSSGSGISSRPGPPPTNQNRPAPVQSSTLPHKKLSPPTHHPMAAQSQPNLTSNSSAAANAEVHQFIRDEIEKMKSSLLSEFRKIIREEIQNSNL